jgi:hypothetical protein
MVDKTSYKFLKKSVNLVPKTGWGTILLPEHISKVMAFFDFWYHCVLLKSCVTAFTVPLMKKGPNTPFAKISVQTFILGTQNSSLIAQCGFYHSNKHGCVD